MPIFLKSEIYHKTHLHTHTHTLIYYDYVWRLHTSSIQNCLIKCITTLNVKAEFAVHTAAAAAEAEGKKG